jgi:hypothetical protein
MNILNFLLANWDSVIVVIAFIALLVFLILKGEKSVVYKILYTLVTEAERQYGGGTGQLKQSAVINWVYERLPAIVKIFITAATLERWVDEAVERAKAEWEKNANIKEYIESGQTITLATGIIENTAAEKPLDKQSGKTE